MPPNPIQQSNQQPKQRNATDISDATAGNDTIASTVTLNNGVAIPQLGLGVFRAGDGPATRAAVLRALEVGYRHIDTAHIYRNEREVGAAVRDSGLPREEIFITTKLWNDDQGRDGTRRAFETSLRALGVGYIDLYLMHWPVPELRRESWRVMESLLEESTCRAIGVSNFTVRHLDDLGVMANIVPAVNQIELSPFLQQRAISARCRDLGTKVAAYSPLTKGQQLRDPRVTAIAREIGQSPAQVLIKWSLQTGHIVVPKSSNPYRIAENADVFDFELSPAHMDQLGDLEENLHTAWNPDDTM